MKHLESAKDIKALSLRLGEEIGKVFVGSELTISHLLIGLYAGFHTLIEDIPGVGKTTLARCLAASTGMEMGRIQFTPDLLPGDIIGMTVWNQDTRQFQYKEGAIMHSFILADEINRASARTQSALLESMQEGAVSIDGKTYPLPKPFYVVATQNPVQFAGTFLLPEAQLDRFGLSFSIGYPNTENEMTILKRFDKNVPEEVIEAQMSPEDILQIHQLREQIHIDDKISRFLITIAEESRKSSQIRLGMSPRATGHLQGASQARALMDGRDYVIPEDVLSVVNPVLRHRLILSAEAKMEDKSTDQVIDRLISRLSLPSGIRR